jgi:hypothetical protein
MSRNKLSYADGLLPAFPLTAERGVHAASVYDKQAAQDLSDDLELPTLKRPKVRAPTFHLAPQCLAAAQCRHA